VSDQIEERKKKKATLQQDISSLDTSADALLTKAETTLAIKCVTEANSLRRTVTYLLTAYLLLKKKPRKLRLCIVAA